MQTEGSSGRRKERGKLQEEHGRRTPRPRQKADEEIECIGPNEEDD